MNLKAWKFYLSFFSGIKIRLGIRTLLSLVQGLFLVPIALLVRWTFDKIVPERDFSSLWKIGLAIWVFYLASHLISLWARHGTLKFTKIAVRRMRDHLIQKLLSFPRTSYSNSDRSQIHSRIVHDTERVDVMTNGIISYFLPAVFMGAVLTVVLLFLEPSLYLALLILFPVLFLITRTLSSRYQKLVKDFHLQFEGFSKGINVILKIFDLIKIHNSELFEINKQKGIHRHLQETSRKMAWLGNANSLTQSFLLASLGIIILVWGGYSVINDKISLGNLLAFYFAFSLLKDQLRNIYFALPPILEGHESLTNLFQLSQIPLIQPYQGSKKINFKGGIKFLDVSFAYPKGFQLSGIDLTIEKGENLALIGPSGSGKSTLIYLLLGFYRPTQGILFADMHPYSVIDLGKLRSQMGVILQEPMLFTATIEENITYGNRSFTTMEVHKAADIAGIHHFIKKLSHGYQTPIGEEGILLSGGQRQRIALARALINKPSLLILDEPTNHLDPHSVQEIRESIFSEFKGITTLSVTHEAKFLKGVDRVITMEKGCIVYGNERFRSDQRYYSSL